MQTKQWHTLDKSDWGDGPWQLEPDKAQWPDVETGLPCLIVRNTFGAWCGYVGVPPGHPLHGVKYSDRVKVPESVRHPEPGDNRIGLIAAFPDIQEWLEDDGTLDLELAVNVHGGLTYSAPCQDVICHEPGEGEPDDVWWFGFDCGHYLDFAPELDRLVRMSEPGTYRDRAYVEGEVTKLAHQLRAVEALEFVPFLTIPSMGSGEEAED